MTEEYKPKEVIDCPGGEATIALEGFRNFVLVPDAGGIYERTIEPKPVVDEFMLYKPV